MTIEEFKKIDNLYRRGTVKLSKTSFLLMAILGVLLGILMIIAYSVIDDCNLTILIVSIVGFVLSYKCIREYIKCKEWLFRNSE